MQGATIFLGSFAGVDALWCANIPSINPFETSFHLFPLSQYNPYMSAIVSPIYPRNLGCTNFIKVQLGQVSSWLAFTQRNNCSGMLFVYCLEGQRDLVSGLIMGIFRAPIWAIRVTNLLTKSPDPRSGNLTTQKCHVLPSTSSTLYTKS